MRYEAITELLAWAGGQDHPVKVTTTSGETLVGIPETLDTHVTALEVYLRPIGEDTSVFSVSLGSIERVDLA